MARSMLSDGMLFCRATVTAVRSRGLALTSPPPMRAATVISLMNFVNSLPRRASFWAFLCLIVLHLEWPDMDDRVVAQGPWRVNSGKANPLARLRARAGSRKEPVGDVVAVGRRGGAGRRPDTRELGMLPRPRSARGSRTPAGRKRGAGRHRLLVRPGLPWQPHRQRRDLRPERADRGASVAPARLAHHGHQPDQ